MFVTLGMAFKKFCFPRLQKCDPSIFPSTAVKFYKSENTIKSGFSFWPFFRICQPKRHRNPWVSKNYYGGVILRSSQGPIGPPCSTTQWARNHLIFLFWWPNLWGTAAGGCSFLRGCTQCYLLRLSGNHFRSSHHSPTRRSISDRPPIKKRPSENWISGANRNGFPALTNGDSMTDDDLKWLKSLCVWCVSRWSSELIVQRTQFSPLNTLNTFQNSSPTGTAHHGPIELRKVIHKIRCSTLAFSCYFVNQGGEESVLQSSSEE